MDEGGLAPVGPFKLPQPRFDDAAFEPLMSRSTVQAQHALQQQQVDRVNEALARHPQWLGFTIEALLRRLQEMPEDLAAVIADEGAGHANHQFLWKVMRPAPSPGPSPQMLALIEQDFRSMAGLQRAFDRQALELGGEGWAFLVLNPSERMRLQVLALPGDASVLPLGRPGLLVCDLWRHAWSDKHRALEAWLAAFWQMVDWAVVESRRTRLLQGALQL